MLTLRVAPHWCQKMHSDKFKTRGTSASKSFSLAWDLLLPIYFDPQRHWKTSVKSQMSGTVHKASLPIWSTSIISPSEDLAFSRTRQGHTAPICDQYTHNRNLTLSQKHPLRKGRMTGRNAGQIRVLPRMSCDGSLCATWTFSRERLRRVLRKKAAVILHLHTFTSADLHLHTLIPADLDLHTFTPADLDLHTFTSADLHLHTFTPADLDLHTFTSADLHLHTFTSADLHLDTLTSADLHLHTPWHLQI